MATLACQTFCRSNRERPLLGARPKCPDQRREPDRPTPPNRRQKPPAPVRPPIASSKPAPGIETAQMVEAARQGRGRAAGSREGGRVAGRRQGRGKKAEQKILAAAANPLWPRSGRSATLPHPIGSGAEGTRGAARHQVPFRAWRAIASRGDFCEEGVEQCSGNGSPIVGFGWPP
jgi:hypothetical protein